MGRQIYVEITMLATLETVWGLTQTPDLHERWDLRFSSITYLPRADEEQTQRFRYATTLGLGIEVEGWGETVGSQEGEGRRTSALRFGSDDAKAIIREGSGYWKYEVLPDGALRFLTGYDYKARWGAIGRLIDSVAFRPMIGWATAWSFDRLRLWAERGLPPESSRRAAIAHALCRASLAIVFLWQGLVPKVFLRSPGEIEFYTLAGFSEAIAPRLVLVVGLVEIAWAILLLVFYHARWALALTAVALLGLIIGAGSVKPDALTQPFNPLSLTIAMIALCVIDAIVLRDCPRASKCIRRPRNKP